MVSRESSMENRESSGVVYWEPLEGREESVRGGGDRDVLLHAVVVRDVVLSVHRLVDASRGGGTSRFAASTSAASTSAAAATFVRTRRG